jgi:uncharacterized protein
MTHSGKFATASRPEEVYAFLANPQQFARLLPDFGDMSAEDETHFTVRIGIALAKVNGHIDLAMNLNEAVPTERIGYRGHGTVAGSQLNFEMQFRMATLDALTEICWDGDVALDGPLAFIAGSVIATLGGRNFELIADKLRRALDELSPAVPNETSSGYDPDDSC